MSAEPFLRVVGDDERAEPVHTEDHPLHVFDAPVRTAPRRAGRACKRGAIRTAYTLVHSYRELRPIALGVQAIARKIEWWLHGGYDGAMAKSEPDPHTRAARWDRPERVELRAKRRASLHRRLWALGLLGVVLALMPYRFGWLIAGAVYTLLVVATICVLDVVGRRVLADRGEGVEGMPEPVAMRSGIDDPSVPLRKHGATVLDTLALRRHEVEPHTPFADDPVAGAYTMTVHTSAPITDEDAAAIATELVAADGAVTLRKTGTAGYTQIRVQYRDRLAGAQYIEAPVPGSRSVFDLVELGRSAGEVPLMLGFPGEHMAIIGSTGSGKSDTFLSIALRLAECDDVLLRGGDISKGAVLGQVEDLFEVAAYDEEAVLAMLTDADAEMRRRAKVLKAARRDPVNPRSKWGADLGPAIVIMLDEAHEFGDNSDIVDKIEDIARIGRETCVSVLLFTQRYSAKDVGTTAVKSQVNTVIMHPMKKLDIGLVELHKDQIAEGWAPHRLVPSSKLGGIGDAGKAFIRSPFGHSEPDLYRFDAIPDDLVQLNGWIDTLAAHRRRLGLTGAAPAAPAGPRPVFDAAEPEAEAAPVIRLGKPRESDSHREATPTIELPSPFGAAPVDTRPVVLRWLVSAFDAVGGTDAEYVAVSALIEQARSDAVTDTHPYRTFAARLVAAGQPAKRLAAEVRSSCVGWEWETERKRVNGGGNPVPVLSRDHLAHLAQVAETAVELRV